MAEYDVDLFVIGAGSGGVRAARVAAGHGARVMIAEEYRVGGTCVIRGCVPKKLLVYASRFSHEFEDAAGFGWTVSGAKFDWPTLIANKDKEIARLEAAYHANLARASVEIAESRAVVEDARTLRLLKTGARVHAETILLANGAHPVLPLIPGAEHAITSNEAFQLAELPRRSFTAATRSCAASTTTSASTCAQRWWGGGSRSFSARPSPRSKSKRMHCRRCSRTASITPPIR